MATHLRKQFENEGFVHEHALSAAVPHRIFQVDLEIEQDRELRSSELAVLSLLEAGVRTSSEVANLMGLRDDRLVRRVLVDLLARNAVRNGERGLEITELGLALAKKRMLRRVQHLSKTLRFDPVRDRFEWHLAGELPRSDWNVPQLPMVVDLDEQGVIARLPELQRLIADEGIPGEEDEADSKRPRREVLSLRVVEARVALRAARVEVWINPESREQRLLVVIDGQPGESATRAFGDWRFDARRRRFVLEGGT